MFKIEHPAYLAFLLALLPIAWLFWRFVQWQITARNLLLSSKAQRKRFGNSPNPYKPFYLWSGVFALLVLALTDFRFGKAYSETSSRQTVVMLALDVSTSMLAEDTRPNRITYAKKFLADWIEQAPPSTRIGLMVFAGSTQIESPPVLDRNYILNRLKNVEPDMLLEQGTDLSLCLKNATKLLASQEFTPLLVLVTDAEDHSIDAIKALENATERGLAVLPIGVGTTQGAPVPTGQNGSAYLKDDTGNLVRSALNTALLTELGEKGGTKTHLIADGGSSPVAAIQSVQKQFDSGVLTTYRTNDYVSRYALFVVPALCALLWMIWKER
jgi:Ca-activated chloride channel homolog